MCVYIYIIYIYTYTYVYMYTSLSLSIYLSIYPYIYICTRWHNFSYVVSGYKLAHIRHEHLHKPASSLTSHVLLLD